MKAITYDSVIAKVGKDRADEVMHEICLIHGGASLGDVKPMMGGLDVSALSESDIAKIQALLTEKPKKDGK